MKNISKPTLYTPEHLTTLRPHEVFVFGSNLRGTHSGGAAALAVKKFGARMGVFSGLQGQSYAIPTVGCDLHTVGLYVNEFIDYATCHPYLTFYVTPIGCGAAGYAVQQIAPLFRKALKISNIVLPKRFVDSLSRENVEMPRYLKTKLHGQIRTLVDVLIELNKEHHYTNAKEAIRGLTSFFEAFQREQNSISFHSLYRIFTGLSSNLFKEGKLDLEQLERMISPDRFDGIDKIVQDYSVEKLMTLIGYLNDFRRYTNPEDLRLDLDEVFQSMEPCGPSEDNPFFMFSPHFVMYFLTRYIDHFWKEFSKDGVLDNQAFFDFMIGRHQRGISKYGLDAVVSRNYKVDTPCHPDALYPYRGGAGPVYVNTTLVTEQGTPPLRRYIPSCGNGIGPFQVRDFFEFRLVCRLLERDEKYEEIDNYFVPVADYSLPVYHRWLCRLQFASEKAKIELVTSLKQRRHDE